jgi:hypothetical protein
MSNLNTVVFNPSIRISSPISASYAFSASWSTPQTVGQAAQSNNATQSAYANVATHSLSSDFATSSLSASWASSSISSSYSITASHALNSGVNPTTAFVVVSTSSNLWITTSLSDGDQITYVTLGQFYNFTASNIPTAGNSATCTLFFYNTADTTSSLAFPPAWIFMGNAPTSITASRSAVLSLKAYFNTIIAGWSVQY